MTNPDRLIAQMAKTANEFSAAFSFFPASLIHIDVG